VNGGRGIRRRSGSRTVSPAGVDRDDVAAGLVLGALADRALGDPVRWHPVAAFGRLALAVERVTYRPARWAGLGHVVLLAGGAATAVRCAERVMPRLLVTMAVTWAALGGRSLEREAVALARFVDAGDLDGARARLPALAGRDPAGLPADELCRAAVESVAENTSDAVVAVLLWGAIAGPAGIAAHRAANTLDAMVGHRSARYERFGWASARLDDALGWPAARLAALLTAALAPLAGGDARAAWRTLRRDGAAHPSPNAGRLEAAFAGALGVRLGGTNRYPSHLEHRPFLGGGRAPTPADVHRAARLSRAVGAASTTLAAILAGTRPPLGALSAICTDKAPSAFRARQ
jgi:adenosylcobinamide-phosphate synthase